MSSKKSKELKRESGYDADVFAPFKSTDRKIFVSIPLSLTLSEAYRSLSGNGIKLLIYVYSLEHNYKRNTHPDDAKGTKRERWYFYCPKNSGDKCGVTGNSFPRAITELIEKGFIDCIASGKHSKTKSIYCYSERWKKYGANDYEIPAKVCNTTLLKKYYPQK